MRGGNSKHIIACIHTDTRTFSLTQSLQKKKTTKKKHTLTQLRIHFLAGPKWLAMLKHEPLFKKSIHCHYKWRLLQPATEDIDPFMCLPVIDPPSNFLPNRLTIWAFCSLMAWLSALLAHSRGLHAETLSEIKWCVQGLIMHTHCSSINILAQILFKHWRHLGAVTLTHLISR